MLNCSNCQKPNTLDSDFCRGCGQRLDEAAIQQAQTANLALLAEGFKLLSEGRFEEAQMVADTVIAAQPSLAKGHSLRADSLERQSQFTQALEAYETAVALESDSTLDRIKIAHLKKVISERTVQVAPQPNRRAALIAGVATTVLVASLSGAWALLNQGGSRPMASADIARSSQDASTTPTTTSVPDVAKPTETVQAPKPESATSPAAATESQSQPTATQPTNSNGNSLPQPTRQDPQPRPSNMEGEVRPLSPNLTLTPISPDRPSNDAAATRPTPAPSRDPEPEPVQPASAAAGSEAKPTQPKPKPIIDIRPSPNQPSKIGGSQTLPDAPVRPTSSSSLSEGRNAFLQGDFARAIDFFKKALSEGADPGSTHQRIAQAYERLGDKAQAKAAYRQAIQVFEQRIARGGGSESDRAGLESCKRAFEALG